MIELFATFIAVAEAGSFSDVARARGVAVSSVSRRVELLEREIGARLLTRSPRRLGLTDAGERFLPRARAMLAEFADAKHDVLALDEEPRGVLTVTAPALFGRRHLVPAVARFLEPYPSLQVELHLTDTLVDLASRRVDVAIRMGSLADGDLVATQLAPVRRLVCASPDYLARRGAPATPADLLAHDCLTVASPPAPPGWWRFAGVNRDEALPVRGPFRSDDTGALLQAALEGVGVVHLASWLVWEAVGDGRLAVLLADARPPRAVAPAIHAVRMPARLAAARTRLFIAYLRKFFGSPPYWDAR